MECDLLWGVSKSFFINFNFGFWFKQLYPQYCNLLLFYQTLTPQIKSPSQSFWARGTLIMCSNEGTTEYVGDHPTKGIML